MELQGKNVVVTGAGRGIGEALARAFHAEGAHLVLADVQGAEDVASTLDQTIGTAVGLTADVGTEEGNRVLVAEATEALGPIDLFFANAGVGTGHELDDTDGGIVGHRVRGQRPRPPMGREVPVARVARAR